MQLIKYSAAVQLSYKNCRELCREWAGFTWTWKLSGSVVPVGPKEFQGTPKRAKKWGMYKKITPLVHTFSPSTAVIASKSFETKPSWSGLISSFSFHLPAKSYIWNETVTLCNRLYLLQSEGRLNGIQSFHKANVFVRQTHTTLYCANSLITLTAPESCYLQLHQVNQSSDQVILLLSTLENVQLPIILYAFIY